MSRDLAQLHIGLALQRVATATIAFALAAVLLPGVVASASGQTWRTVPAPAIQGYQAGMNAVACPLRSDCLAVGSVGFQSTRSFTQRWNGQSWSKPTWISISGAKVYLDGISCAGPDDCYAVGGASYPTSSGFSNMLVEHWDGRRWAGASVPTPTDNSGGGLNSISCPTSRFCMAVGSAVAGNYGSGGFVELFSNGHWSFSFPQTEGTPANAILDAVSCASPTNCTAVGSYADGSLGQYPLIDTWDGQTWSPEAVQEPFGIQSGTLSGISCYRVGNCIAVGSIDTAADVSGVRPIALELHGSSWLKLVLPSLGGGQVAAQDLWSVSCNSGNNCTAVGHWASMVPGHYFNTEKSVVAKWDGSHWSIQPVRQPAELSSLSGVACTRGLCFAVGSEWRSLSTSSSSASLIEVLG